MKPAFFLALLALPALANAQLADPQPEELLQIAFPKWTDEEGGRVVSIPASAATRAWDARQGRLRKVAVVPRHAVRVAPDRLLLLAAMTPVGEGGERQVSHGTPIGLAAYTFKPGKDGWQIAKRQEPFDLQGFEGQAQLAVVPLSAKSQALHVSWGSCWQGRCVDLFALYAIGADGVKAQPLVLQKIKGGNVHARPDCAARLGLVLPAMAPPDGRDEKLPPGPCYAIEGRWQVAGERDGAAGAAPGPLTLRFSGVLSPATAQGKGPAQRVEQTMTFQFRGGRYLPVSGSNPIPDA